MAIGGFVLSVSLLMAAVLILYLLGRFIADHFNVWAAIERDPSDLPLEIDLNEEEEEWDDGLEDEGWFDPAVEEFMDLLNDWLDFNIDLDDDYYEELNFIAELDSEEGYIADDELISSDSDSESSTIIADSESESDESTITPKSKSDGDSDTD